MFLSIFVKILFFISHKSTRLQCTESFNATTVWRDMVDINTRPVCCNWSSRFIRAYWGVSVEASRELWSHRLSLLLICLLKDLLNWIDSLYRCWGEVIPIIFIWQPRYAFRAQIGSDVWWHLHYRVLIVFFLMMNWRMFKTKK